MQLRLFLVALQFYSRLRVTGRLAAWVGDDPLRLAPATRFFPLVGLVVASLSAVVYAAAGVMLPHEVALVGAIGAGLLLTGAFHERGLAGYCAAMGGHADRARLIETMHDSHIGTYGAVGLLMVLLGRFQALAAVDPSWIGVSLMTAAGLSRGCSVGVMVSLPRLRFDAPGLVEPIAHTIAREDAVIAVAMAAIPVALAAIWTGEYAVFGVATAFAVLTAAWLRRRMRRRLGGCSGACLGAVQQFTELAFLVGALAMLAAGADPGAADPPAPDNVD